MLVGHSGPDRFPVHIIVDEVTGLTTGSETKVATVRASVKVEHACFPNPLPLYKPVAFQFTLYDDGWRVTGRGPLE
jgi:hypothetical protein